MNEKLLRVQNHRDPMRSISKEVVVMKKTFSLSVLVLMLTVVLSACGGGGGGGGGGGNNDGGTNPHASKTWTHPSSVTDNISPDGQNAYNQQVAMDNNGNAVIVWQQYDNANWQIFKSEYRNSAWTHPSSVTDNISPDGQNAEHPQVAMDDNGNAVIAWHQSDGANEQIFKSEYRNGAWTHPSSVTDNISPDLQNVYGLHVAMDNNGNAIIVWYQSVDGINAQIFKSEYRNSAWTHPASLTDNISPDGQPAEHPQVAMDDNGNAVIAWHQYDNANWQIFKSEYRNGAWTHPSSLTDNISPDGTWAYISQVAMDDNGNAVIVWQQKSNVIDWEIFKSEYRNSAWTHPSSLTDNISPDGQSAYSPRVAMDNNGNAVIVWYQFAGTEWQAFKSEYRNGAWTHPSSLTDNISPDGQSADSPQVAMDNNGNAVIVWYQFAGTNYQIFKSEYRNGAWTHPSSLTDNISPDGQDAHEDYPQVAMDNNGNAVIVWGQSDGAKNQIFKSEFR